MIPQKVEMPPAEWIQRQVMAVMANEGRHALFEGVAARASDIDVVMINGYGLARGLGGPMHHAGEEGPAVMAILEGIRRTVDPSLIVSDAWNGDRLRR
jgi:3-hydroxyacyl-CoA dehydrogenase